MTEDEIRQRFEAWISAEPFCESIERFAIDGLRTAWPGAYRSIKVDLAWEAWRESWKQAIGQQSVESQSG